jgi:hypothetical protein
MKTVPQPRFGHTIFCDDLREEVGGKVSYMGIYRQQLNLATPFPTALPKLVVMVTWQEPAIEEYIPITVQIFLPGQDDSDEPAVNATIPADPVNNMVFPLEITAEDKLRILLIPATFAPMQFEAEGKIRVQVVRGDEIYKLGSLLIRAPDASPSPIGSGGVSQLS